MTNEEKLNAFVQSVYLIRYNRYIDDITDEDGVEEKNKTIDWCNSFLDDFELEADWLFMRDNDYSIGTISSATQTFELDRDEILRLVSEAERPLIIQQDGSTVSSWEVVNPKNLARPSVSGGLERVTVVNGTLMFSRDLNDGETSGSVLADVITPLPRLSTTDVELLDIFEENRLTELLKLGIAKNATLPDIVQGGLSPSFAQKYKDALDRAIMKNDQSSVADTAQRDDFSGIGGIY